MFQQPIRNLQRWRTVQAILLRYGFDFLIGREEIAEVRRVLHHTLRLPMGEFNEYTLPERVRLMLQELGPFYVKLGQILSSRANFLPQEWITELSKLQDAVPPFPYEEVQSIIAAELGALPEDIFAEFDVVPVAAASIGQVHRARLTNGTPVVVKVQRPNIQNQVQADIAIMREIARLVEDRTQFGKRLGLIGTIEEFSQVLREEMDYRNEAANADRLRKNLADFWQVRVPVMYWSKTTPRVLTMEWISGVKINDLNTLKASGCDLHELSDVFIRSLFQQLLVDGFFHADPHPGNLFVDLDGCKLAYIDLGMTGSLMAEQREMLGEIVLGILRRDSREVARLLMKFGTRFKTVNENNLRRAIDRIIMRYMDVSLAQVSFSEMMSDLLRVVFANGIRLPSELSVAVKALMQGEQVARDLDPEIRVFEILQSISKQLLIQRLDPRLLFTNLADVLREANRLSRVIPRATETLLTQMAEGTFHIGLDIPDFQREVSHLYAIANRLTAALILAGMIIGSAIAMGVPPEQSWRLIPILGIIGFILSMVVAGMLVSSVFLDQWDIRRKRGK
jgi:ubiquinone biosynthesis protein